MRTEIFVTHALPGELDELESGVDDLYTKETQNRLIEIYDIIVSRINGMDHKTNIKCGKCRSEAMTRIVKITNYIEYERTIEKLGNT